MTKKIYSYKTTISFLYNKNLLFVIEQAARYNKSSRFYSHPKFFSSSLGGCVISIYVDFRGTFFLFILKNNQTRRHAKWTRKYRISLKITAK